MDAKANRKADFQWEDPLLIEDQLTEEERMVRDTAHAYAQDKLMPRIRDAFRHEQTDPAIFSELCDVICDAVYDMLYNDGFLDLPGDWRTRLSTGG